MAPRRALAATLVALSLTSVAACGDSRQTRDSNPDADAPERLDERQKPPEENAAPTSTEGG